MVLLGGQVRVFTRAAGTCQSQHLGGKSSGTQCSRLNFCHYLFVTVRGKVNKTFFNLLQQSSNEEKGFLCLSAVQFLWLMHLSTRRTTESSVLHWLLDSSERLILPSSILQNISEQPPLKPDECWLMEGESSVFRTILLILVLPLPCLNHTCFQQQESLKEVLSLQRDISALEKWSFDVPSRLGCSVIL